jgi:hemolysin-activating ACP:hemolysin acyltransferase
MQVRLVNVVCMLALSYLSSSDALSGEVIYFIDPVTAPWGHHEPHGRVAQCVQPTIPLVSVAFCSTRRISGADASRARSMR